MFEVPEQADPTNPTEGPTDQPPEVPDQTDPTDCTDGPTDQRPQQEQEQEHPTDPKMPSNDPTDQPTTVPPTVPPVATSAVSSSVFHPKVPTMGGLIHVKHNVYSAWTSGKPLADWTGLDMAAPGYEETAQLHPTYEDKGFQTHCTGFEAKFTKSSRLHLFQRKLLDHFVTHGMDSITYLLDPAESMTMVNIITHHTHFTTDVVKLAAPLQAAKYDSYDRANDCATRLALVDCLDNTLHLEIEECLPMIQPSTFCG